MGTTLQDILERKGILLKPNDMNDLEKAKEIANSYDGDECDSLDILIACMGMAQWKDEQLKQIREDAKSLYYEISDCIDRLVKSRLSKNGIGESNALQQMESIMVKTQQFLQTI